MPFFTVAPYVGAWIETGQKTLQMKPSVVAPYVGAWIETTLKVNSLKQSGKSHPTWVRGLKPEEVLAAKSSVCNHNIRLDEEVARLLPAPKQVELGTSWSSLVKKQA